MTGFIACGSLNDEFGAVNVIYEHNYSRGAERED
jgi:hypothetical protein